MAETDLQGADARQALWTRYDAGELTADELDARLRAVDHAGSDPAALAKALDGPVRVPRPGGRRRARVAWVIAVTVVVGVLVAVVAGGALRAGDGSGGGDDDPGATPPTFGVGPVPIEEVDCPELDEALARFEGLDEEQPPANPALLSEPVALPDGYTLGDEETVLPGNDPNLSMSVSAGDPPPIEVLARNLTGPLSVTMRAWEYESAETAGQAGMSVLRTGVCTYDMTAFQVPDRPEINGNVVSGVIPTTAFAGWRQGERRFSVAVAAGADDNPEATAAAEQLAGLIATLEYDAAAAEPAPG